LLVSWCASGRCGMVGCDEVVAGVGDLVQRTGDGHTGQALGGQTIGRSGDAVCGLYRAQGEKKRGFLG
jgi:hypothetical protein